MHCTSPLLPRERPSRRLFIALFPVFAAFVAFTRVEAGEPIGTYSTLTLKDGRTLSAVRVVSYTNTGILVRHAGGATSIRRELLPEHVTKAVHLSALRTAELNDPAFLALADKPAVVESAVPTVAVAKAAANPAIAPHGEVVVAVATRAPAVDAASSLNVAESGAAAPELEPPPAGEGNIPEFFANQTEVASASAATTSNLTGRIVIGLPSGETRLLADVEIRGYPAELLATYLAQARARADEAARKLLAEAGAAEKEGRGADCDRLLQRARQVAQAYAEDLPPAPYSTRSDSHGHFSLQHDLPDFRLVAVGQLRLPQGEVTYHWVGINPQPETLLTEANASLVSPSAVPNARFAAR